jgi:hypothetical protein
MLGVNDTGTFFAVPHHFYAALAPGKHFSESGGSDPFIKQAEF